ncbi:hypothetical protein ACFSTC_57845 [Nonomuraea ferruginea]
MPRRDPRGAAPPGRAGNGGARPRAGRAAAGPRRAPRRGERDARLRVRRLPSLAKNWTSSSSSSRSTTPRARPPPGCSTVRSSRPRPP